MEIPSLQIARRPKTGGTAGESVEVLANFLPINEEVNHSNQ